MKRLLLLVVGVAGVGGGLFGYGCRRAELSGPPTLKPGRDECAECGMIIAEDRFSSALLAEVKGSLEHLLFDDVGCMIDYEHEHAGEVRVVEGFVHDYDSRMWVSCGDAVFLFADRDVLRTPMSSGIGAFAGPGGAERMKGEVGGALLDYPQLIAARLAWKEEKYGRRERE